MSDVPKDRLLQLVGVLAKRQVVLQREIADQEEKLKALKQQLFKVSSEELPDLMFELGLKKFTLTDGSVVEIKPFYSISIPKADKHPEEHAAAMKWLRANGHEGIIKNEISVPFGKGEEKKANELLVFINSKKLDFERSDTVHASTLKVWAKSLVEEKHKPPPAVFGLFIGNVSEVKLKEAK